MTEITYETLQAAVKLANGPAYRFKDAAPILQDLAQKIIERKKEKNKAAVITELNRKLAGGL
jgi:hypothetical protein